MLALVGPSSIPGLPLSGGVVTGPTTFQQNLTVGGSLLLPSQVTRQFLASPSGAAGVPAFRGIAAADVPLGAAQGGFTGGIVAPTSQTFTMAGLGAPVTPIRSGRVLLIIQGTILITTPVTAADGIRYYVAYGTGTAPSNGAASTGTACVWDQIATAVSNVVGGTTRIPFIKVVLQTGLVLNTAYWFDLVQAQNNANNTGSITLTAFSAAEL